MGDTLTSFGQQETAAVRQNSSQKLNLLFILIIPKFQLTATTRRMFIPAESSSPWNKSEHKPFTILYTAKYSILKL